jgi:UrcA family protein
VTHLQQETTLNITTRIIVSTLALGAAALASAGNLPDVKVQYRASELASTVGATNVYSRMSAAAELSCERLNGAELARKRVYHNCVSTLLAKAVHDVQSPTLASVHEARTGEHIDVAQVAARLAGETPANGRFTR